MNNMIHLKKKLIYDPRGLVGIENRLQKPLQKTSHFANSGENSVEKWIYPKRPIKFIITIKLNASTKAPTNFVSNALY